MTGRSRDAKAGGGTMRGSTLSWSAPLVRNAAGRRGGPTEAVVAWAFREELPKAPRRAAGPGGYHPAWGSVGQYGRYLSLVDMHGVNAYGCVPDFSADSQPCADALAIADIVAELDGCDLDMPADWQPAPELDGFAGMGTKAVAAAWQRMVRTDEKGRQVLRLKPSDLIVRRAVLGVDLAGLTIGPTEERCESHADGRPKWFVRRSMSVIVGRNADGSDRTEMQMIECAGTSRNGKPLPGAYRKPFLDPDPVGAIVERAEHQIWHSALVVIHEALAGRLETVDIGPPAIPAEPWVEPLRPGRVLVDPVAQERAAEAERQARWQALRSRFPGWARLMEKRGFAPA